MVAVLGAPGVNHFDRAVIALQWEAHPVDRVASLDLGQEIGRVIGESRSTGEALIDLIQEAVTIVRHGSILLSIGFTETDREGPNPTFPLRNIAGDSRLSCPLQHRSVSSLFPTA